jgi:hypothetical protein
VDFEEFAQLTFLLTGDIEGGCDMNYGGRKMKVLQNSPIKRFIWVILIAMV